MKHIDYLETFFDQLTKIHASEQTEILKVLNAQVNSIQNELTHLTNLDKKAQSNNRQTECWEGLQNFSRNLHQSLDSDSELDTFLAETPDPDLWKNTLEKSYTAAEPLVRLPIEDDFWITGANLSRIKKLKKAVYYLKHPVIYLITNKKINRKIKAPLYREFDFHQLAHYGLALPTARFLMKERHFLLLHYSEQIRELHKLSETLKDAVLMTEKLDGDGDYWQLIDCDSIQEAAKSASALITTLSDTNRTLILESNDHLAAFTTQLRTDFVAKYEQAGTVLLPQKDFSIQINQRHWSRFHKQMIQFNSGWKNHFQAIKDEWQKDLEIADLQLMLAALRKETESLIRQKSDTKIFPVIESIRKNLLKSHHKFEVIKSDEPNNLKHTILKENRTLLRKLSQEEIPDMLEAFVKANIPQTLRGFTARLNSLVDDLTDRHIIIKDYHVDRIPPKTTTDEVPMKDLIASEILIKAIRENELIVNAVQSQLDAISRNISALDQIVEFNLEAALELLIKETGAEGIAEAQSIVSGGLDRTGALLNDLEEKYTNGIEEAIAEMNRLALDLQKDFQNLGDNEKILALKIRAARANTQEKIIILRKEAIKTIVYFLPRILKVSRSSIEQVISGYRKVRKISGLETSSALLDSTFNRYLMELESRISQLPYIYHRLFSFEPVDEQRFFHGREEEMNRLKSSFEEFKSGFPHLTVIVGEKGNGKSTLVNFAEKEFFMGYSTIKTVINHSVLDEGELVAVLNSGFGYEKIASIWELKQAIQNDKVKRVCIVEDIHNLFLRTIDGFDTIEQLLSLISDTQHHVYWLLTSGLYGWEYLNDVIKVSSHFKNIIRLVPLSEPDIRKVILGRHNLSGYRLVYMTPEIIANSRTFKKLTTEDQKQDYLQSQFFEKITDVSAGNIKSALLYWLKAIHSLDTDQVNISLEFEMDYSFLYQLPAEELYSLAAFIQHEYLTSDQYAAVFRKPLHDAELLLGRMNKKGYLQIKNSDYFVHPMLYRPVIKVLTLRKILN